MTRPVALLLLATAVVAHGRTRGQATGWAWADWLRLCDPLTPEEITTVALHGLRGRTMADVGDWLGVTRGRAHQHWQSAQQKLRGESH